MELESKPMSTRPLCASESCGELESRLYARAIAPSRKNSTTSNAGLGSRRISFHTTILIDSILRAGKSANDSVRQVPAKP